MRREDCPDAWPKGVDFKREAGVMKKARVLILEAGYDQARLLECMRKILEVFPLELEGKRVLLKPNLLGPWPGESGIITHPQVVRAAAEALRERGAEVQAGDNPGIRGYGRMGHLAEATGMLEAMGEGWVNLAEEPRKVPINSRFLEEITVAGQVMDFDLLISLPKFKTHVSTIITGAVKNSFGFLVGGEKARMHALAPRFRDFGELMVDIYQLRVPDLVVMDAVTAMQGNGPSCEDIRPLGLLIASDNGVAVDVVMAEMMGLHPEEIPLLEEAARRGLGPLSTEDIEMEGPFRRIEGFRPPSTLPRRSFTAPFQRLGFRLISRRILRVDRERCTACRTCRNGCPAGAIEVKEYPRFDPDKCILCYCCYELCPEHAISLNKLIRFIQR